MEWVNRFLTSLEQGNVDHVLSLLTEDVMIVADGGGKVTAFRHPVQTRNQVARVLLDGFQGKGTFSSLDVWLSIIRLTGVIEIHEDLSEGNPLDASV
ncbi:hypothetical protein P9G84_12780 [Brevibacillus centrosporus]|uniref:hypothetical protein n=1 Tax=Brevibacillus centrosporus TaxID=54910 RepID=UPI001172874C|nr:hypothetical protein [Brevibacillus centrosporus]MEC2129844.1 hypothetical protein [Brevibacillus centrosporus]GED32014.1 hypothetical protein BCE02nite_31550 [Brevibacillus centrosporus]